MEGESLSVDESLRSAPLSARPSDEKKEKMSLLDRFRKSPMVTKSFQLNMRKVKPDKFFSEIPMTPSLDLKSSLIQDALSINNQKRAIELLKQNPELLTDDIFIKSVQMQHLLFVSAVLKQIKTLFRCNTMTIEEAFPNLSMKYDMSDNLLVKCLNILTEEQFIELLSLGLVATNIFSILLSKHRLDLLKKLLEKRLARPSYIEFREILTSKHTGIAVMCMKCLAQKSEFINGMDVIKDMIDLFNDKMTIMDAFYLLSKVDRNDSFIMSLKYSARKLNDILERPEMTKAIILDHWNPILVAVIASDFCEQIKNYSTTDSKLIGTLAKDYKLLAERIQNEIDDVEQIRAIYTDTSYPGGTLLELATLKANKYRKLLKSPLVSQLVKLFWYGKHKLVYGIDRCSYIASCLNPEMEPLELWSIFMAQPLPQVHSFFQFKSWLNSCKIRYSFEVLWLILFAVHIGVSSSVYVDDPLYFRSKHSMTSDRTEITGFESTVFRSDMFFNIYIYLLVANYFQRILFMKCTGHKYRFDARGLFNFLLIAVYVLLTIETEIDTILTVYDYYMGMMCIIVVLRLLVGLSVTSTFGKIITMVVIIFKDIVPYLALLGIVSYGYTMAAYVMFNANEEYRSIAMSFKTLFSAATGNFTFDMISYREEVCVIFLISWVILANILMLNLLIAVLSSRYEKLAPKIQADYVSILYSFYKAFKSDPTYGGLAICPTPMNAINLAFVPLYFTSFNKEKLSKLLHHISYLPMLLIAFVIFTIQNAILAPIAYFYCIYVLFISHRNSCYQDVAKMIVFWILFAPLYMVFLMLASSKNLITYLYVDESEDYDGGLTDKVIKSTLHLLEDKVSDQTQDYVISVGDMKKVLFKPRKATIDEFMNSRTADRNRFTKIVKTMLKVHNTEEDDQIYDQMKLIHKFADHTSHTVNLIDAITFLRLWDKQRLECVDFYLAQKGYDKFIKARNSFFLA
mmetsp:Transcript_7777/g.14861  ORF Transcript_7777/g.14861 Transcript_7777/m.14861 type:complete len:968 (-) Transcript_7777:2275-5178(-)